MTAAADRLAGLIRELAKGLVDDEDAVKVSWYEESRTRSDGSGDAQTFVVFAIDAGVKDFGRLIGKKGAHVDAIRRLSIPISTKLGLPLCEVRVLDKASRRHGDAR